MKMLYNYICTLDYFMDGELEIPEFKEGNIYQFESTNRSNYIFTLANVWPHYFDVDEDFLSHFKLLKSWST